MLVNYSKLVYICPEQGPLEYRFSDPFPISRAVKQGSVLSPLRFFIADDPLLKTLKCKHACLSMHGNFMGGGGGGGAHADDLRTIATSCLGTWWKYNLSAIRSVQENIVKARRAFFAFGKIDAFQGHLNPLSAVNIFVAVWL